MEIQNILTSEVVELTSLKEFFSSDKDSLIQLIGVYVSDTEPRVSSLEESILNVDYESVRSISHFLKSSLGLMGVSCLSEITELEEMAKKNEPETVIKERISYVIPILKESLTEYKTILGKLEAI